jgi:signal transduction histidine kinase
MHLSYWFNTDVYSPLELTLVAVGSFCWVLAYTLLIRNARKRGFMEMPLFIGIGNLAWEGLYGFVFAEAMNFGAAIVWGVRIWFFLDCYMMYLSVKTAREEITTPIIRKHIVLLTGALLLIWLAFLTAMIVSGWDNVPFGAVSAVKLGGATGYVLNVGISLLFVVQYLRLYQTHPFSHGVAWAKMTGTGVTTIFFALIDPQNLVVLTCGSIAFITDITYITLLYTLREEQKKPDLVQSNLVFPVNPRFEELWAKQPEFFEFKGLRLRKLKLPDWRFKDELYERDSFVLEGIILCNTDKGDAVASTVRKCIEVVERVMTGLDWHGKPLYFVDHAGDVHKVSAEGRVLAHGSFTTVFRGLHNYLIASRFARISVRIVQNFAREPYQHWKVFDNFDDALTQMLNDNFMRPAETTVRTSAGTIVGTNAGGTVVQRAAQYGASMRNALSAFSSNAPTTSYHEERIEQLYTILAKIEASDLENIPTPDVPEGDLYADIFNALQMVLEDKKSRIWQLTAQRHELERQASEIQLANNELSEQNYELAALNHEKNELMGIVSHDLKNPIGAVRGFADLIRHGFVPPEQIVDVSGRIVDTANRMLELVQQLLEVNQLESGAMRFNTVAIDITPTVESVVWQYQEQAKLKNITIEFSNDHRASTIVLADERAIIQVLDNIISNAVKYSLHGKRVFVRVLGGEHSVCVHVQDEGPGISADDMTKLFGKFARLSAQPTGGEHSTGLGLSIVKKMVEAMNGRVWCESELGNGATFVVELPAAETQQQKQ